VVCSSSTTRGGDPAEAELAERSQIKLETSMLITGDRALAAPEGLTEEQMAMA